MPRATQLNLQLANDIGVLAKLCRDLSNAGVNLLALAAEGVGPKGVFRLLVANRDLAEGALKKAGYTYASEDVLFEEIKNRPGALAKAVEKLAKAKVNIKYAYATTHLRSRKTAAVIAVDEKDVDRALKLLG